MLFNNRKTTNVKPRINTPVRTPRSENLPSESEDLFRNIGIDVFSVLQGGHLPPFLRHVAEGERGRCEDGTGALEAREQQDHARRLHAGRELA
jgi:hypothetical protein